jgi:hypothetical protein
MDHDDGDTDTIAAGRRTRWPCPSNSEKNNDLYSYSHLIVQSAQLLVMSHNHVLARAFKVETCIIASHLACSKIA